MSDYLFTSLKNRASELTASIKKIYQAYEIECIEYQGDWGSLSVSPSPYRGLQPLETETHICIVLGGPVFYFRDNSFLTGANPTVGTQALLERYLAGELDLEYDVSGPFQIVVIDKKENSITCMTDLMLFIPAYINRTDETVAFGSHIDAVARVIDTTKSDLDKASIADFILHGVVTFPYTVYSHIKQAHPATFYEYKVNGEIVTEKVSEPYWLPHELYAFDSVNTAADSLREGIRKHINAITDSMTEVAQFISGGEDSRTLSGILPERLKRDAFIFLDSMNREGRIAEKVAKAYGAEFHMGKRDPLHYIDILEEASSLVGTGHEYMHCHSLRFDREFNLDEYSAVFGGYSSDVFLKGYFVRKDPIRSRLSFLPEKWLKGEGRSEAVMSDLFDVNICNEITHRRRRHVQLINEFRKDSVHEWFQIWPATMRSAIPNHFCNRRLFASYEVFMCHEVIKVSASVPTEWKLNRRLFHTAFQSSLLKTKWIRHGDGHLPYFKIRYSALLVFINFIEKALKKIGLIRRNDTPWNSWDHVQSSAQWYEKSEISNRVLIDEGALSEPVKAGEVYSRRSIPLAINFHQSSIKPSD